MFKRLIASLICFTFSLSNIQYIYAQDFSVNQLPVPGTMVGESATFSPLALKGLIVNPQKPLEFQFIVDTGDEYRHFDNNYRHPERSEGSQQEQLKTQSTQLVKYFLAGLTIPEGDLWVNLSPYEKTRMVPEALGQTDLGRDLLAQDYILKQLTASLIYPEKNLGKEFWSRVYAKAQKQFGTTNIPVNTFNKVWILPDQAQVYENVNAAFVTKSTLKVMLDEDYIALQKSYPINSLPLEGRAREGGSIGSQIIRQIILPEITKEVNTGKNFAQLRQIYQALILAKWYKETIQNGLLDALYTNKNKVTGVNVNDPTVKEQIYNRYLQAYKKGAFNYIKEDPAPEGQVVSRKYFSGGTFLGNIQETKGKLADIKGPDGAMISLIVRLKDSAMLDSKPQSRDAAMLDFSDVNSVKSEMKKNWEYFYQKEFPGLKVFKPDTSTFDEFFNGPGDKHFERKRLGDFVIQYNPRRASRRPAPPTVTPSVYQPFSEEPDKNGKKPFNYISVDYERSQDSLFRNNEINGVSGIEVYDQPKPFSRLGHILVIPERGEKQPNYLIKEGIQTALGIIKDSPGNQNLKIAFNSWLAFGTQNHLHLQTLYYESPDHPGQPGPMPIESKSFTIRPILGKDKKLFEVNEVTFSELENYPAKVIVLETNVGNIHALEDAVGKAVSVLQNEPWTEMIHDENGLAKEKTFKGQPHNVVFTKVDGKDQRLRVYIFPRKVQKPSSFGIGTGIAFFELSGEMIVTLKDDADRKAMADEEEKAGNNTGANLIRQAKVYDEITEGSFRDELRNNVTVDYERFQYLKSRIVDAAMQSLEEKDVKRDLEGVFSAGDRAMFNTPLSENEIKEKLGDTFSNEEYQEYMSGLLDLSRISHGYFVWGGIKQARKLWSKEKFREFWPEIIKLYESNAKRNEGADVTKFFEDGFPSIIGLIKDRNDFLDFGEYLIEKLSKNENLLFALQYSIPVVNHLIKNVDDLKRIIEELIKDVDGVSYRSGDEVERNRNLCEYAIPAVSRFIQNEDDLKSIVQNLQRLGKSIYGFQVELLFRYGLPSVMHLIRTREDMFNVVQDLTELQPDKVFQYGLPNVKDIIKSRGDLRRTVMEMKKLKSVREYNSWTYQDEYPLLEKDLQKYSIKSFEDLKEVVSALLDHKDFLVPLKIIVSSEYKGIADPRTTKEFLSILHVAERLNPNLDINALFQLNLKYSNYFRDSRYLHPEKSENGRVSILISDNLDFVDLRQVGLLDALREVFHIPNVYLYESTEKEEVIYGIHIHYRDRTTSRVYVPEEYGEFVILYLKAKGELTKIISKKSQYIRNIVISGVEQLGKSSNNGVIGNKASGFLIFDRLGLKYPAGIVLSEQLVRTILSSSKEEKLEYIYYLNKTLNNMGINMEAASFSVRSSPRVVMPGVLETVINTKDLLSAIYKVASSWETNGAKAYRKREGIADTYDLPIIIQQWASGYKEEGYAAKRALDSSLPLYAAGAYSTRNPNTNEEGLYGQYLENTNGDELMTLRKNGIDVNRLAKDAPDIYQQLVDAGKKLEEAAGPQEVEFVVNAGKVYFLQTRKISFSPQAEVAFIKQQLQLVGAENSEKYNKMLALVTPRLEKLQEKLGNRKIYKVKEDGRGSQLAQGVASTPGAMQGYLVWNMDKARQLISEGKAVVLVSHEGNRNQILDTMFNYSKAGLITAYGNSSSHEADLTRLAGIPSLINLDVAKWRLKGDEQGIILKNGQKLEEGTQVVIDGDKNALFVTDEDILKESGVMTDVSYGINIPEKRKEILAPYLNDDGSIKPEITVERLIELNNKAAEEFKKLSAGTDGKAAFMANLKKHFLHDLLLERQKVDKAMNGGIDLNQISVLRNGKKVNVQFDPDQLNELMKGGFNGFTPVIINMEQISSPYQLLGIKSPEKTELLAKA